MERLLILNPGSTSTKIAVYEDEQPMFVESLEHKPEELAPFENIIDQYEFRMNLILKTIERHGMKPEDLTAIVSRGGLLPPINAGAYRINEDMVWQLTYAPGNEHASNLGAVIAHQIAKIYQLPAFIYDGVTVAEMLPILKLTGLPEMERKCMGHNLNMRAAAMKYAKEQGKTYQDCTVIVAHLGGGISVSLHNNGNVEDIANDEDGAFSPERAGALPAFQLVQMAMSGQYTQKELLKKLKSQGGLMGYFGTTDSRVVEKMAVDGDEQAQLIYEAMALNVAKNIAAQAAVVNGRVDAILLTGGIAYSQMFTDMIAKYSSFIAPIVVYKGENEMESLALGGLRVLRGEEMARDFVASR